MEEQTLLQRVQEMRNRTIDSGDLSLYRELCDLLEAVETHLVGEASRLRQERINQALGVLSYSEEHGLEAILQALPPEGGPLVASRIADRGGYTRSVLVNTIRKVQSAGLVDAHSMGASGTMIRFRDGLTAPVLLAALHKRRNPAA